MIPRELSDSPTRFLDVPPPRARSPPREQELIIRGEELIVRETEERGEIENLEITIRQTKKPAEARRSALERIHPPRSRSNPAERADRHRDRSRSRTKPKPAAGPAASSRRSRRSSPTPEYRNPSPPSPAPGATSTPSSSQARRPRSPTRRATRSAVRDGTFSSRIEELENQIDSVLRTAERGEFNELALNQSVMYENRRLHQEGAAGSSKEEVDPGEEERKARLLGSFILHLVNKARNLRREESRHLSSL
jgi:hypothetical protein